MNNMPRPNSTTRLTTKVVNLKAATMPLPRSTTPTGFLTTASTTSSVSSYNQSKPASNNSSLVRNGVTKSPAKGQINRQSSTSNLPVTNKTKSANANSTSKGKASGATKSNAVLDTSSSTISTKDSVIGSSKTSNQNNDTVESNKLIKSSDIAPFSANSVSSEIDAELLTVETVEDVTAVPSETKLAEPENDVETKSILLASSQSSSKRNNGMSLSLRNPTLDPDLTDEANDSEIVVNAVPVAESVTAMSSDTSITVHININLNGNDQVNESNMKINTVVQRTTVTETTTNEVASTENKSRPITSNPIVHDHMSSYAREVMPAAQVNALIKKLSSIIDNEEKLEYLDSAKGQFLFTSDILLRVMDVTPSVKTKLGFIAILGPLLTDPKERSSDILSSFRYAEEREHVSEILKTRAHNLNSAIFSRTSALMPPSRAGRGLGTYGRQSSIAGRGPGLRTGIHAAPFRTGVTPRVKPDMMTPRFREGRSPRPRETTTPRPRESSVTRTRENSNATPRARESGSTPRPKESGTTPRPGRTGATPRTRPPMNRTQSTVTTTRPKSDSIASLVSATSGISDLSSSYHHETFESKLKVKEPPPVSQPSKPKTSVPLSLAPVKPTVRKVQHAASFSETSPKTSFLEPNVSSFNLKRTSTMSNDQLGLGRTLSLRMPDECKSDVSNLDEADDIFIDDLLATPVQPKQASRPTPLERSRVVLLTLDSNDDISLNEPFSDAVSLHSYQHSIKEEEQVSPVVITGLLNSLSSELSRNASANQFSSYEDSHDSFFDSGFNILASRTAKSPPESVTRSVAGAGKSAKFSFDNKFETFMNDYATRRTVLKEKKDQLTKAIVTGNTPRTKSTSNGLTSPRALALKESMTPRTASRYITPTRSYIPAGNTSSKMTGFGTSKSSKKSPPPTRIRVKTSSGKAASLNDTYLRKLQEELESKAKEDKSRSVSRPNASGQVRKLSQGLDIALKKALSERLLERDISVRENLDAIVGLVPVDVADPRNYTNMKPESPVGYDSLLRINLYSHNELARRNFCKDFDGINQRELEKYLTDVEFKKLFNMSKSEFLGIAKWRQVSLKKKYSLF